jgi:hypothetical protein
MYRFQPGRDHGKPWAWGKRDRDDGPNDHDGRGPRVRPGGPDGYHGGPRGPEGMGPGGRHWDGEPRRGGPDGPREGLPPFRGPGGGFGGGVRPELEGLGPGPRFEGRPPGPEPLGPPPPVDEPPAEQKPAPPADVDDQP